MKIQTQMLSHQVSLSWVSHACVVSVWLLHWSVDGRLTIVSQSVSLTERLIIVHWPVMVWKPGAASFFFMPGGSSVPVSGSLA